MTEDYNFEDLPQADFDALLDSVAADWADDMSRLALADFMEENSTAATPLARLIRTSCALRQAERAQAAGKFELWRAQIEQSRAVVPPFYWREHQDKADGHPVLDRGFLQWKNRALHAIGLDATTAYRAPQAKYWLTGAQLDCTATTPGAVERLTASLSRSGCLRRIRQLRLHLPADASAGPLVPALAEAIPVVGLRGVEVARYGAVILRRLLARGFKPTKLLWMIGQREDDVSGVLSHPGLAGLTQLTVRTVWGTRVIGPWATLLPELLGNPAITTGVKHSVLVGRGSPGYLPWQEFLRADYRRRPDEYRAALAAGRTYAHFVEDRTSRGVPVGVTPSINQLGGWVLEREVFDRLFGGK